MSTRAETYGTLWQSRSRPLLFVTPVKLSTEPGKVTLVKAAHAPKPAKRPNPYLKG